MDDDFADSDLGALFAEVDRLQATSGPSRPSVLQPLSTGPPGHPGSTCPGPDVAVDNHVQSSTPNLLRTTGAPQVTPRSSKEIRGIFSRRSSSAQEAPSAQQPAAHAQPNLPASRFHQQATLHNALPSATSANHHQLNLQRTNTTISNAARHDSALVIGNGQRSSAEFEQFAYQQPASLGNDSLRANQPAAMQHQVDPHAYAGQPSSHSSHVHSSAIAHHGSGNIANKQRSSQQSGPPAQNSTASNAPAVPIRAEINVGECATVEVNFRPHDNIVRIVKRHVTSVYLFA